MKKLLVLITIALLPLSTWAYDAIIDGIYYDLNTTEKTATVTYLYEYNVSNMGAYSGDVFIPSEVVSDAVKYKVTRINGYAFYYCSKMTSVSIPQSVTSIGLYAFSRSGLASVTIPSSVTSLGRYAFAQCSGLKSVSIPHGITSIEDYVFEDCNNLISVTIEATTPYTIKKSTFTNRKNATLHVPKGSKTAFEAADIWNEFKEIVEIPIIEFADAKVKALCVANWDANNDGEVSVTEAAAVDDLGDVFNYKNIETFDELQSFTGLKTLQGTFCGCSYLTSVVVPNNVAIIGDAAFSDCIRLKSITLPSNVTVIGESAFQSCGSLTTFTIPNSVTSLRDKAFRYCNNLKTLTIGSGVSDIRQYAFANCSLLTDVFCLAEEVPNTMSYSFEGTTIENVTLHVPEASLNAYKARYPWNGFKNIVAIGNEPAPDQPQCATPTIKYIGGKLTFDCETEGVEFVYNITMPANTVGQTGNNIDMPYTNTVSVYAKKEGYMNSDIATADIDVRGIQGDTNRDGKVTISDAVGVVNIILNNGEPQAAPALEEPIESMEAE